MISNKLPVTGTTHILPFEKLSPSDFERLCLSLVTEEGYTNAQHYGDAGSDQARDIVAYKVVGKSKELWYFQCKRKRNVNASHLKPEVEKVLALGESRPAMLPRGIVFVVAGTIPAKTRDAVCEYTNGRGLECGFWGRTELDQRTNKHPVIVRQFFQLISEDPSESAEHKFDEAYERFCEAKYGIAAQSAEDAAALAATAQNLGLEKKARVRAAGAWYAYIEGLPIGQARAQAISKMRSQVTALEQLALDPGDLELEKSRLAILDMNPAQALTWASKSLELAKEGSQTWANALLTCIHLQSNNPEKVLQMIDFVRRANAVDMNGEIRLAVSTIWVRTLAKAGKASLHDVEAFIQVVREVTAGPHVSPRQAMLAVGDVASEFNPTHSPVETLRLLEFAYELGEQVGDPGMTSSAALQTAEIAAHIGNVSKVTEFLGKANAWVEKANSVGYATNSLWADLRANWLLTKGRILVTLGEQFPSSVHPVEETFQEAYRVLEEARQIVVDNRSRLQGAVELFLADVTWWLGSVASDLGRAEEAARLFRSVRTESAMTHVRFATEVGMRAWMSEAESWAKAGNLEEASKVVEALLASAQPNSAVRVRAEKFRYYIEQVISPVVDWLKSPDAALIAEVAVQRGLRHAVAAEVATLASWWREWGGGGNAPESELLDWWGRGGFIRIAAAIRAKPHAAISVDARSVEDIRRWARILCPLFDTVIIKWKGELGAGWIKVPIPDDYRGPSTFGGHGYFWVRDRARKNWHFQLGWGNQLPQQVAAFLAHEALPLVSTGRLVIVPAPLVGCTQSAVGWTDNLLVDGFLGGVVNVAKAISVTHDEGQAGQRVLDLTRLSIPYMKNIALSDLAKVLDETEEWVPRLRSLLMNTINSDNLRKENWAAIYGLENDIKDACKELKARFITIASGRQWHIGEATGNLSAASAGGDTSGNEPVTGLLRAVALGHRELAPWIPYWRMNSFGGSLSWSCPLDNPSMPPEDPKLSREVHSWLYPGTGGGGHVMLVRNRRRSRKK